jgi:hypothetical protein
MPEAAILSQASIDASFDLAEHQDQELMALAARSALACATVDMCSAYLDMIRRRDETESRGGVMDLAARERMVREDYLTECTNFITAWRRGGSVADNMHVIEVAVRGFARLPDVDEPTKSAGAAMLLDFTFGIVSRLPPPEPLA